MPAARAHRLATAGHSPCPRSFERRALVYQCYTAPMDASTAATIQAITALVSLLLTGVLVALTAYYATQTRRTVTEMVEGRELALMPTVTCRLVVDHARAGRASNYRGSGTLDVAADYTSLVLANVGNAAALDVSIQVVGEPRDRGRLRVDQLEGKRAGIIGVAADWQCPLGFGKDHYFEPRVTADPHAALDQSVVVHVSYANAYGRQFTTRVTFDLGNEGDGSAWLQRDSSVELRNDATGREH